LFEWILFRFCCFGAASCFGFEKWFAFWQMFWNAELARDGMLLNI